MRKNKIIGNYIYNMMYQLINIIVPFITIPYIARVLGPNGTGIYDYTYSYAFVFTIICLFGMTNYGSKRIAYVRDSKEKMSNEFWSIWLIQLSVSIICLISYIFLFVVGNTSDLRIMFIMQFPLLLASLLDISWLYVGMEDFGKTITRNILVKIIGLILIFILVKGPNDVWLYILINSGSAFIGNLSFWIFLKKYVNKINFKAINVKCHIRESFLLFIPQIATQIYTTLDRAVIGGLSNTLQVGYYSNSQKIARLSLVVVTSLSFVMMPRIANMYANDDKGKVNDYLSKSLKFSLILSIFITTSLIVISKDFVPVFFGDNFKVIIPYMIISSVIVIFISVGGVFATQFSLPTGRTKEYTIPLVLAAVINPIINIILVPSLGALGGVFAIVITEFVVMFIRIFVVRKELDLRFMFKGTFKYLFAGIIGLIVSLFISKVLNPSYMSVFIEGTINAIVYFAIILIIDKELRLLLLSLIRKKMR
ncbi:oligosaccharide flippase family protein [Clostridium celatum]|mgnify:CR=1 FL=1|uniref:oligosaccharide flippase family protein n=1 Tax=Clostridium celatum TaxID=36834 RepID=UPI001F2A8B09|nr:oligosaccharide flippase family protein [Clostridium celatum]MCE9656222.1 oligosaccharide flippase family protein [Clostridium celatum]MDU2266596.1 oligosaccharide flippase family protein [Clostridium celatum]MDU6294624.1 oligosaccharide flippase family protein [Clostridium celatum]